MNTVGTRLKHLREEKNLTLRALAKLANVSHSFIADIESGRSQPSLSTIEALTNALKVPISVLLENDNELDIELPFRAKVLADALLEISNIYFKYNLDQKTFYNLIERAVKQYGPPEPVKTTEPAAHGPNFPGTGAMNEEDGND